MLISDERILVYDSVLTCFCPSYHAILNVINMLILGEVLPLFLIIRPAYLSLSRQFKCVVYRGWSCIRVVKQRVIIYKSLFLL